MQRGFIQYIITTSSELSKTVNLQKITFSGSVICSELLTLAFKLPPRVSPLESLLIIVTNYIYEKKKNYNKNKNSNNINKIIIQLQT